MGGNNTKKIKEEKKIHQSNPEYELPRQKHRHNQLQNSSTDRPIELSWLQQNNHNQIHNHDIHHHDEQCRRIPLAINRWPKINDRYDEEKSKSFVEEYVHE